MIQGLKQRLSYYTTEVIFSFFSILNLSEFLPSPRGIATLIGRAEFKNMLSRLSYHLPNEQFDMLWNR